MGPGGLTGGLIGSSGGPTETGGVLVHGLLGGGAPVGRFVLQGAVGTGRFVAQGVGCGFGGLGGGVGAVGMVGHGVGLVVHGE